MTQYSISEAREQLAAIVGEAEAGKEVVLTRRGREVAALVPIADFKKIRVRRNFGEAYAEFLRDFPPEKYDDEDGPDIGPEYWESIRDRSPGREVDLWS